MGKCVSKDAQRIREIDERTFIAISDDDFDYYRYEVRDSDGLMKLNFKACVVMKRALLGERRLSLSIREDIKTNKAFHNAQLRKHFSFRKERIRRATEAARSTPSLLLDILSPDIQEGKLLRHTFLSAAALETLNS